MTTSALDGWIVAASFSGFLIFIVGHVLALRLVPLTLTARAMLASVLVGLLVNIGAFLFLSSVGGTLPPLGCLAGVIISCVLFGLLVLNYLAWVFGIGVAALRIRLLQLLLNAPGHKATQEQILARFNAAAILRIRLARLVGSGHMYLQGDVYKFRNGILALQTLINTGLGIFLGASGKNDALMKKKSS